MGSRGASFQLADHCADQSFLYVPGDKPDMLAKATERDVDAVVVDLEDAVAIESNTEARRGVARWLSGQVESSTA